MADSVRNEWWRGAVLYQVYPRSYKDSNGDGIGDLPGITEKLDYIAGLGVDGIWLSPFFKSPMKDYGYDVSDYCDVDPLFGTLDDFRVLLAKAHALGLKVIIDMIMNHTSDRHPWFIESEWGHESPKADWYIWADPKPDGTPPNNWLSVFGGPAWQFSVLRGQYYMHSFLKEQPDLNYHNPAVIDEMMRQCRFWLDLGVDGFRLDAVNHCVHDSALRDNPPRPEGGLSSQLEFRDAYAMQWHVYDKSRPENITLMRRMRALLDEYPDRMAVAEIGDDYPLERSVEYTAAPDLLHTAYNFSLMTNRGAMPPAGLFRSVLNEQATHPGDSWPSWAFSNHDVVRAASRWSGVAYGHDSRVSKTLLALLVGLRGTAFMYQGEELGLPEVDIPFDRILDPWGKYLYPKWKGRDGCRTPMPWSGGAMAGFTVATDAWLPVPESHCLLNAAVQEDDPHSVLSFTRILLRWRRDHPALATGEIAFTDTDREDVLVFERRLGGQVVVCLFNLTPAVAVVQGRKLQPYEACFVAGSSFLTSAMP